MEVENIRRPTGFAMSGPGVSTLPFRMVREASATDTMSSHKSIITRPRQVDGEFFIRKSGTGRDRVRAIVFRTSDGFEGVSTKWNRDEAYDKALKARAAARSAGVVEAKPAPAAPLLHNMHESDLCAELERRGYAVCPAELIGLDLNGDALAIDQRVAA